MFKFSKFSIFPFLTLFLLLGTLGRAAEQMNSPELMGSQIKKKYQNSILAQIKKQLPNELKVCPLVIEKVRMLKREYKDVNVAEEWSLNCCGEYRVFFILEDTLKGTHYEVNTKETRVEKEMKLWNSDKEFWGEMLFYIDEINDIKRSSP